MSRLSFSPMVLEMNTARPNDNTDIRTTTALLKEATTKSDVSLSISALADSERRPNTKHGAYKSHDEKTVYLLCRSFLIEIYSCFFTANRKSDSAKRFGVQLDDEFKTQNSVKTTFVEHKYMDYIWVWNACVLMCYF